MKHYVILCSSLIIAFACKDSPPEPQIPERVKLTLIDASVKEAYLHIAVTNPASNETLTLQHNGTMVMTFAAVADTNIADTALTQITTYQYTATVQTSSTTGKSNTISAQTLAPTSHSFAWQTYFLGDGNNSSLSDVAIINDTLAYACGEIYMGSDPSAYNVAKWNGRDWTPMRIRFIGPCSGGVDYPPIRAMWAFSGNNILFTDGGSLVRYDGTNAVMDCGMNPLLTGALNKIYAFNANDVYAVGGTGNIVHFNGTNWQRLESGTTTQFNDVYGAWNPVREQFTVFCAGRRLLKLSGSTQVELVHWDTTRNIRGVWTKDGILLHTVGSGVFENTRSDWREVSLSPIGTNAVRGIGFNDIFVVGDFGLVAHYNGLDWHVFPDVYDALYYSLSVKSNRVVLVGERNARGVITMGRRN